MDGPCLFWGHRTWGDGYIQGTDFVGYSYFINVSKQLGENHELSLTAFGAPQWHNQRNQAWMRMNNGKYNPILRFADWKGENGAESICI